MKMGRPAPTASPSASRFVKSEAAKQRLSPFLSVGQSRQDHGRAGLRHHRPRPASSTSTCRASFRTTRTPAAWFDRQRRRRPGDRLPQRHAAGRLFHAGGPRARVSTSAPCPASTMPASTRSSSRKATSNRTSCATSATATPLACSIARRARRSTISPPSSETQAQRAAERGALSAYSGDRCDPWHALGGLPQPEGRRHCRGYQGLQRRPRPPTLSA